MIVSVTAEYACHHPPRMLHSGEWEVLRAELMAREGDIDFKCPACGAGASALVLEKDGAMLGRFPAAYFDGMPGAKVTKHKHPNRN